MYIYGSTVVDLWIYACISIDVNLCLYTDLAIERSFLVYIGGCNGKRIACFLCRCCACKVRFVAVLVELGPRVGELLCSGGFVLNLFCASVHSGAKCG